jgi:hypothetical protein
MSGTIFSQILRLPVPIILWEMIVMKFVIIFCNYRNPVSELTIPSAVTHSENQPGVVW